MKYEDAINFLFSQLPMYQRQGKAAFKKDLTNIKRFCESLGQPQDRFQSIHIAGTNGKGSTSHMLAAILTAAGYKTGLYTSPHYRDYRERIRIDGKMIAKKAVSSFVQKNMALIHDIMPSFFEMSVAMAFDHFSREKVDVAVVETGLGGRLDSTNIIEPLISVITNIGWDHMDMLGDTLEKIAVEKAGIIKRSVPVVIGQSQVQVAPVFEEIADQRNAPLFIADKNYRSSIVKKDIDHQILDIKRRDRPFLQGLLIPNGGAFQKRNILPVLQSIEILNDYHDYSIEKDQIRSGLANIKRLSGFTGRWQILGRSPLIITDSAHNEPGLSETIDQIMDLSYNHLHIVLGMVRDKDIEKVLPLFPQGARYYFCAPDIPRAKSIDELKRNASSFGLIGDSYTSVRRALAAAKKIAQPDDVIFVGGSSFVTAEVV